MGVKVERPVLVFRIYYEPASTAANRAAQYRLFRPEGALLWAGNLTKSEGEGGSLEGATALTSMEDFSV